MATTRKVVGGSTLLLSTLGLVICLAGVAGIWMLRGRVEAVGNAIFSAADDSLVFVEAKIDRVKQAVDNSRQRVSGISKLAERLKDEKADARKEAEPLLHALDEVFAQLKAAESWLESSLAAAQGVSRVSEAVVSSEYAATYEDSTGVALAQRLQEVSEKVAEVLATLQVLRKEIVEARDTGKLAREVAVRIVARVVDLDGRLATISARIEKFDARVATTKASIDSLQQQIHWWIVVGAVGLTVLFVWFAISQISMVSRGWRMMRDRNASQAEAANR